MFTARGLVLFVTLVLFWALLNPSMAPDVLLIGVVAAFVITLLFGDALATFSGLRKTPQAVVTALVYLPYFLKELVKANLRLARIVLSPDLPLNPGIVKVRTRLKSPMGRLLLANSITLTPGTLTVELDGEWLYVHCVNLRSADTEAATADIVAGFERFLEIMYG